MTASSGRAGTGGRAKLVRRFGVAALVACAGLTASATAAQAEETTFTFDEARINLGDQKGLALIDPSVPDPPATITFDVDETGVVSGPATGFSFPDKALQDFSVDSPLGPLVVDALIEFTGISPITGTYDTESGEMALETMDVSALVTVYLDGTTPEDAIGKCKSEPIPLPLATEGEIVDDVTDPENPVTYAATPFVPEGAAVATWETLPATTQEGGSLPTIVCPAVDDLLGGPGGIWLNGREGGEPPPPVDTDGDGVPDASDQCPTVAGPASNNGCPVVPPPPGGKADLSVSATGKGAKPGKKSKLTATVRNTGDAAATGVEVCVKAPKKKATVKKACQSVGDLAAGGEAKAKFKAKLATKAKQGSKVKFKFTATGEGLAAEKANVQVKVK